MPTLLRRALDAAFGHPRGVAGRVGGSIMAFGNRDQERAAIGLAALSSGEVVLIVGHGPGVGMALAAVSVSPGGHVIGVDPSPLMRAMAAERCVRWIRSGDLEVRPGSAENTNCANESIDVAISVNNVMLWDRPAGFTELHRVLRPGGRLVVTVHRHVLDCEPTRLCEQAAAAGFLDIRLNTRDRRAISPAIELVARRIQ
ncbi:class I SAM-dependent methyltransferase [Kutzneria sp. CA-103260]|uniref:class I SAM-dependent methyltransferase n=1 Tax=Kutzneria sp. CA-103260 TaxID=2802641 RepID=UPI001BAB6527|nr:methyltransferase domain-containing protein [Kutzneria sp. CA-103260]QUQ65951.1 2-methoxy-6-polyprenyl-1,4-benzoquinol methylase, mitochondrial [Kutzneria sp. CA-103260]